MHRFLLLAALGFIGGVWWRSAFDFGWSVIALCALLIVATGVIATRYRSMYMLLPLLTVCVGFGLGVTRMHSATPVSPSLVLTGEVSFEGVVVREPDTRESFVNIVVATESVAGDVLVRAPRYIDVSYNDTVAVVGEIAPVKNFATDNDRVFNYRGYLAKDSVYYVVSFPEVRVIREAPSLVGSLLFVKETFVTTLQQHLMEPYAALAAGITVGERRSLGEALTDAFRDTGLIHIVVLSGYNITIVILFVSALLMFLPPRLRFAAAILSIVAFTLVVGASATVVRAALMGSIAALGTLTGRVYDALHALVVSALAMLVWNPYLLAYDPSFQLSFIATVGLLVGVPLLSPYLSFVPDTFHLRDIVAATVATQVAVLPLLAYMIGEVSLVALLVNALVLPVIPITMLFVFLLGVFGFVPLIAQVVALISSLLLAYVVAVVEFFASLPVVTMKLPEFSLGVLLGTYVGLIVFVIVWRRQIALSLHPNSDS